MKFRSLMTAICVLATANIVSAAPFAYIANSGTHNVTVIDTAITPIGDGANTIKATVPLPDTGPIPPYAYGVAVGASGQYVYVGLQETNEVAVIDAATNAVVKRIGLGGDKPGGLAVNTAETRLYVASNMSNTLIVINITGGGSSEVGRVTVDDASISNPEGVVLSPDGLKAYVANATRGNIAEIALDEINNVYTKTTSIPLNGNSLPSGLAISSDGTKLYVSGTGGTASVVNTATRVATNLAVEVANQSVAITPDNSKIYAPTKAVDKIYVIDGVTDTVSGTTYSIPGEPWGSSVSPDGTKLYLAMYGADSVKVFNTSSNTVTATISLPAGAKPISIGDFIGPIMPWTITSSQGANCNVLPFGAIPVANNFGRTFSIIPTSGACQVFIDGNPVSVGQPSTYTFSNVIANGHIINATQIGGIFHLVEGDWISSVGGYLVSTPAGISQLSKKAHFQETTNVSLNAASGFRAINWTGDCAVTLDGQPCLFNNLSAPKTFGATVIPAPAGGPLYNVTKSEYYQTWAACAASAANGDFIKISSDFTTLTTAGPAYQYKLSGLYNKNDYSQKVTGSLALTITNIAIIADDLVL